MEYKFKIRDKEIILSHDDMDFNFDVDELTNIDIGNVQGEKLTIDTAMNRIALLLNDATKNQSEIKLELDVFESNFKKALRQEASKNGNKYKVTLEGEIFEVKLTEKSLETCFESDAKWIKLKNDLIEANFAVDSLNSLYWSMQNKNSNLKSFVLNTTPEEFWKEVVEGRVNGILIKK